MKVSYTALSLLREKHSKEKLVFCDGTFDLLHPAHIEHLKTLREYGDILIIGIMSDEWVKMRKGDKRPILSQEERLEMIDAVKYVDYSFLLYDEKTKSRIRTSEALTFLRPDVFVTTDKNWEKQSEKFPPLNIKLIIVPPTPAATLISTTKLIQRITGLYK